MRRFAVIAALLVASCGGGPKTRNIVMEPEQVTAVPPGPTEPSPDVARPAPPVEAPPPVLAFPDKDDYRNAQPAAGPARPLQLPAIVQFKAKNGVAVYLVEDHTLPVVSATLVFQGGAMNDPAGKEGLAQVCVATVGDSTKSLDKVALGEALADMASGVGADAGLDTQTISFDTLTKNLDATADIWAEMITAPGLRQEDFARNQADALSGLKQRKGSTNGVAGLLWGSILYGEKHPFGRHVSEASYQALELDDCQKYVADYFKPQGAQLWIVGDVNRGQVEAMLATRFAKWTGKPKATPAPPKPQTRKGRIFLVDVPDAPQSTVLMGYFGPKRNDKDYFANAVVGSVLGSGVVGRIDLNLREDKGWTYGARAAFSYSKWFGVFTGNGGIVREHTAEAVEQMVLEVTKEATSGVTDEELAREKAQMVGALPAQFETGRGILGAFRLLVYYGLPLDYYAHFVDGVNKLDKKAVDAAAKKNLRPKDLTIFVVGDAAVIRPGLEQLIKDKKVGDGELVVLDVDGKVVAK
jgi:predicted Zn-dependent peptidase